MSQSNVKRDDKESRRGTDQKDSERGNLYVVKRISYKKAENEDADAPDKISGKHPRNYRRYGKHTLYL